MLQTLLNYFNFLLRNNKHPNITNINTNNNDPPVAKINISFSNYKFSFYTDNNYNLFCIINLSLVHTISFISF